MVSEIVLDVNIVVDILVKRTPYEETSILAFNTAVSNNIRIWVYVGSVQTLHYVLARELMRNTSFSFKSSLGEAKELLETFSSYVQWLPALSEDGEVWEAIDPEDEQLKKAFNRLGDDALFISRDVEILDTVDRAVSPEDSLELLKTRNKAIPFVDLSLQRDSMHGDLQNGIFRVIHSNQFINGPAVKTLGGELATFSGVKHAIPCTSGTDALLLALMALGVKPGDEIIVPAFTFIATGSMVSFYKAVPVFADVDSATFTIDPEEIKNKITDKTVGIIPVSLYGQCAPMEEINIIAAENNLWVIEDAAQSFGADYKGKKSCNISTLATTSFFPAKPLGCYGDGGAVFTNDDILADKVKLYANHGQAKRYYHSEIGINGRMDSLQAAIVSTKLKHFSREIDARNRVAKMYTERLKDLVKTPVVLPYNRSTWAQYTIQTEKRNLVREKLADKDIPTAVHYPMPLPRQEAFAYLKQPDNYPVSNKLSETVMSLPMHPFLKEEEIDLICNTIKEVLDV